MHLTVLVNIFVFLNHYYHFFTVNIIVNVIIITILIFLGTVMCDFYHISGTCDFHYVCSACDFYHVSSVHYFYHISSAYDFYYIALHMVFIILVVVCCVLDWLLAAGCWQ